MLYEATIITLYLKTMKYMKCCYKLGCIRDVNPNCHQTMNLHPNKLCVVQTDFKIHLYGLYRYFETMGLPN